MEVELIDYTKDAIEKLILTKNTRLLGKESLDDIKARSNGYKLDQLKSMFVTIQSPFEFVHFTFLIRNVSRSYTHQLVRTRGASYAQESLRAVNVSGRDVYNPTNSGVFAESARMAMDSYASMVEQGHSIQDAREILPTGILTNIMMCVSLRELSRMAEVRLCVRTSGEYQDVFKEMKQRVMEVYPEFEPIIRVACARHGRCCFPNYTECPVKEVKGLVVQQGFKDVVQEVWEEQDHQADPGIYK